MIIAYYVIGATLAAWLSTWNGRSNWALALLMLPVMFLAHYLHGAIAHRGANGEPPSKCQACRNRIGLFRRLSHQRFCSEEHERVYLAELQALAIIRLHSAAAAAAPSARPAAGIESPLSEFGLDSRPAEAAAPVVAAHADQTQALIVHPEAVRFRPWPA